MKFGALTNAKILLPKTENFARSNTIADAIWIFKMELSKKKLFSELFNNKLIEVSKKCAPVMVTYANTRLKPELKEEPLYAHN